jgi:hypothetical protein
MKDRVERPRFYEDYKVQHIVLGSAFVATIAYLIIKAFCCTNF